MELLTGKKILITSGGTVEKWDEVRGHTNLARGTIGKYLVGEALQRGADVILLHGYFAETPPDAPGLRKESFMGIDDLTEKIRARVIEESVDAVIMTAAVSDWVVDFMTDAHGNRIAENGKIQSDVLPIVHFKKAPKVITEIKNWRPDLFLVGFKLEHTDDESYLVQRARTRMETWRADLTVANPSTSLHTEDAPHYLVPQSGDVQIGRGKKHTAAALMDILSRSLLTL